MLRPGDGVVEIAACKLVRNPLRRPFNTPTEGPDSERRFAVAARVALGHDLDTLAAVDDLAALSFCDALAA